MSSLWPQPASDVLEAVASRRPAPGGGATAALTGSFGTALLSMAGAITVRKRGEDEALARTLAHLSELRGRLQTLADEDVAVFRAYVDASRRPKGTEQERHGREAALRAAGQAAMNVPLTLARTVVEALSLAPGLAGQSHPEVVSDVGAGAAILEGALHAALLTVEINLPHVSVEERAVIGAERNRLEARGHELAAEALHLTRERLPRGRA
ncbi:cyclodeaminase/cyclohydrolase family protein [Deinococcus hopiensis]|nr:cyclodeaminase/cyclohydrolase family protein [Deinococcus hopiensis]